MGEITSIPIPSRWGRIRCWFGFHDWGRERIVQRVIPTGQALLITERKIERGCRRFGCGAELTTAYKREAKVR